MYICNCNGITESEVRASLCRGVRVWDDVHAHYDCEPCCGQCEGEITQAIADHAQGCGTCAACPHTPANDDAEAAVLVAAE